MVGAGPGGLAAALRALERGASVTIFDKKQKIGIPVKCGEYFPVKQEMAQLLPNLGELASLCDVPMKAVDNVCRKLRVISPFNQGWEFDFEAYILDRTILESDMADRAEKLGAEIRLGRPAHLYTDSENPLVGPNRDEAVRGKVVIAADGFPSEIAEAGGLPVRNYMQPINVAINYEFFMTDTDCDPEVTEMYIGTEYAPGGYAWVIPKGEGGANIGTGIRTPFSGKKEGLHYLDRFLKHPLVESRLTTAKKCRFIADVLPVDGPIARTYDSKTLAVGDSAGMVMPTNGGGIITALITGRLAGEVAADHIFVGVPLSTYEERWKHCLGKEMEASTEMRRLADRFMGHDRLFHWILKLLRTHGIKDVITCRVPTIMKPLLALAQTP